MEVEVRSSGDVYHKLFASSPLNIQNIIHSHFQSCNLHEGKFRKNGSIISWNYTIDRKPCVSKQVVENLDEEKKTVTFKEVEGDMVNVYTTMLIHLQVFRSQSQTTLTLLSGFLEYEKENEDVPHPLKVMEFALSFAQSKEAHHAKA